jgi:CRISPR-associated protein Csd1
MILQALNDYYRRKMADADPARRLPAFGSEEKEIPFIFELTRDGRLAGILDTRSGDGKKKVAARFVVPKGAKKTSGIAANLLWDNAEYVLAVPDAKKLADASEKGKAGEYTLRLADMQSAFKARIAGLPAEAQRDDGIRAVLAFMDGDPKEAASTHAVWPDIAASNPVLSFRLAEDATDLVCQRPLVAIGASEDVAAEPEAEVAHADGRASALAMCLVSGEVAPAERLHTAIKGVWGAQTSGANIVSFNLDAFNSFGKSQGANAPVGAAAAFAYTTALNHLLDRGSRQRMQVGDASTVFWAQKPGDADMEDWFAEAFGMADDPDQHTEQVRALFDAIHSGRFDGASGRNLFFVLGLTPNAARLSVRFWHVGALADIADRIKGWFADLRIARGPNDIEFPPLKRLLGAVCLATKERPGGDIDRLPPTIAGDVMRSILGGGPLPALWLNAAIQRCRAEQQVSYLRACVIKACLNRSMRRDKPNRAQPQEEITEMLDPLNTSPGYRLGRLFAVLERAQEESAGGAGKLNATIRDRYYGAASSTPVAVFTTLLRLKNHHLAKLANRGRAVNFEKLIGEIVGGLGDFPKQLPLQEQGRFAIGYYHQRQALFVKAEPDTATNADDTTNTTPGAN